MLGRVHMDPAAAAKEAASGHRVEKRSHGKRVRPRAVDWRVVRQRQGQWKAQDLGAQEAHDASGHDWG